MEKEELRQKFDRKVVATRGTTNMPKVVNAELEHVFEWIQELNTDCVRFAKLTSKALTDSDKLAHHEGYLKNQELEKTIAELRGEIDHLNKLLKIANS